MTVILILLFAFAAFSDAFGQASGPLELVYVRQEAIKPYVTHSTFARRVFFRIFNRSDKRVTIFGENDGRVVPVAFTSKYDLQENKYLFYNRKETPNFETFLEADEKKQTFVIQPNESVEFQVWLKYSCEKNRYKLAIFFRTTKEEEPKFVLSDEVIPDNSSLTNCKPQ